MDVDFMVMDTFEVGNSSFIVRSVLTPQCSNFVLR